MKDTTRALKEELNNSLEKYLNALNEEINESISEARKQLTCLLETGVLEEYHMFIEGKEVSEDEYWNKVPICELKSTLKNLKKAELSYFWADASLTIIPILKELEDLTYERLHVY